MDVKLSKYCWLYQLTDSVKHPELVPANRDAAKDCMNNLHDLTNFIVDKIFDAYGVMDISSAFRCPLLNTKVGGSKSSQHLLGQAIDLCRKDFTWEKLDEICLWIVKLSGIKFGQLIRERDAQGNMWLHISTGQKCQFMDQVGGKYMVRYL